jgi:hypothetical protein
MSQRRQQLSTNVFFVANFHTVVTLPQKKDHFVLDAWFLSQRFDKEWEQFWFFKNVTTFGLILQVCRHFAFCLEKMFNNFLTTIINKC